jgi:hypothetical protein
LIGTLILSFGRKGGSGGPPPEHFYIFEALGLNFWRFLTKFANKLHVNELYFTKMVILSQK